MIDYTHAAESIKQYLLESHENIGVREMHLSGTGAIAELENKLKLYYGAKYALCTNNATNALFYIGQVLNLSNCEIVTTPLTFPGTISSFLTLGCKFHFADIDENFNISPDSVRNIAKNHPNIKAIIGVDFAGMPHNIEEMRKVADEFSLIYISDAAQSLGATINANKASSLSDVWVTSFCPGKTIFAGEGACIITNNEATYIKLLSSTQHVYRQKKELGLNNVNEFALNGRINPLAAILANTVFFESINQLIDYQVSSHKLFDYLYLNRMTTLKLPHNVNSAYFHVLVETQRDIVEFDNLLKTYDTKLNVSHAGFNLLPNLLAKTQILSVANEKGINNRMGSLLKISKL